VIKVKGELQVVQALNGCLKDQLTAINQFFLHARMARDWGLGVFNEYEYKRSIKAMKMADDLIERVLFLEAEPEFNQQDKARVGSTVREMLQNDLDIEYEVTAALKKAMSVCERVQDYDTWEILSKLLDDTEMDHAYWLEK